MEKSIKQPSITSLLRSVHIITLLISVIMLVGLDLTFGYIPFIIASVILLGLDRDYAKHLGLLHISVLALSIAPIGTDTNPPFALQMGAGLLFAVAIPYLVTRYVYKSNIIRFPVIEKGLFTYRRAFYILLTALIAYLLLPPMLRSDNSYMNWPAVSGTWDLWEAYIGLNFVGIWDELFFILTCLAILKKFFPFYQANLFQAVIFTSFLFSVGFEGWSFLVIFVFALLQGYIFKKTKSLWFILGIHLTLDLVLHLALLYLHFPEMFPYFIT